MSNINQQQHSYQPQPIYIPQQDDREDDEPSVDLLAVAAVAGAVTLFVGMMCWFIGWKAGERVAVPPAQQVIICQTERKGHLFWTEEKTTCKPQQ